MGYGPGLATPRLRQPSSATGVCGRIGTHLRRRPTPRRPATGRRNTVERMPARAGHRPERCPSPIPPHDALPGCDPTGAKAASPASARTPTHVTSPTDHPAGGPAKRAGLSRQSSTTPVRIGPALTASPSSQGSSDSSPDTNHTRVPTQSFVPVPSGAPTAPPPVPTSPPPGSTTPKPTWTTRCAASATRVEPRSDPSATAFGRPWTAGRLYPKVRVRPRCGFATFGRAPVSRCGYGRAVLRCASLGHGSTATSD